MFGLIVAGRLVSNTVIVKVLSLGEMSLFYCGTFLFHCGNVVWTVIAGPKALVSLILAMSLNKCYYK